MNMYLDSTVKMQKNQSRKTFFFFFFCSSNPTVTGLVPVPQCIQVQRFALNWDE